MDFTEYTDEALDQLRVDVLTEQERRQTLTSAPALAASLAASYEAAIGATPEPVVWDGDSRPAYQWGPGVIVTHDGRTYRNQSGTWLNGHYQPGGDGMASFWVELPGETPVLPWTDGMPLTNGQYVTNAGKTWRYLGTDVPSAPANWKPTVANATWAEA